jgi:hypothetical protein
LTYSNNSSAYITVGNIFVANAFISQVFTQTMHIHLSATYVHTYTQQ